MTAATASEYFSSAEAAPVLDFVAPIYGFPHLSRFEIVPVEESGTLLKMQSLEDPEIGFIVATPGTFFPDYDPQVPESAVEGFGLDASRELDALVILSIGETWDQTTANLHAPIVFDPQTFKAMQVITVDESPLRAPITGLSN